MRKPSVLVISTLLICALQLSGLPQQKSVQMPAVRTNDRTSATGLRNRVTGYTAWDDDFFYVGVQVNKPTRKGTNADPFSRPLEDDAVLILIQTDNDHTSTKRTEKTALVALSAAGGAQLYFGPAATPLFAGLADLQKQLEALVKSERDPVAQEQKRALLLGRILKFQVKPGGAATDGAAMPGYTAEVAIPWSDLGGKPAPGTRMGFNVAAQSITSDSPPLQSLAPKVTGPDGLENPSLWKQIVFNNAPSTSTAELLVCPRVFGNKPAIDGEIGNGEWNGLSGFVFGESGNNGISTAGTTRNARVPPDFRPQPPRPAVPPRLVSGGPVLPAHRPQPVPALVLARYEYRYQADRRKETPPQGVAKPDGSTILVSHPLEGVGPWFSFDSTDWHRRQLQDLRRAGVDVVLPLYRASVRDRQLYADRGLIALTTALRSLRRAGQDYPLVGLYLDTIALQEAVHGGSNLRSEEIQAALYAMIRNFFLRIPPEFRAQIPLGAENGGGTACLVLLSDSGPLGAADRALPAALRSSFRADFGADLVILGGAPFKGRIDCDGYFTDQPGKSPGLSEGGWIKTACVYAGTDAARLKTEGDSAPRPRRDGATYRADWTEALRQKPDWILLPAWNDYASGEAIAPTLEYGYTLADLTSEFTRRFAALRRENVRFLQHDLPPALVPGTTYAVHLRVQNAGQEVWTAAGSSSIGVTYRWLREGRTVASGPITALTGTVLPGQNISLTLPVAAVSGRAPLMEGLYTLEIAVAQSAKKEVSPGTFQPLAVPVQISASSVPAWAAAVVRTEVPATPEAGSVYSVDATLRNDGSAIWRPTDNARVTLRLYRADDRNETPVAAADATALIPQETRPGQEVTVRLSLPLVDPDGKSLPVGSQEALWTYVARWEVAADRLQSAQVEPAAFAGSPATGVSLSPAALNVVNYDFGVRFVADGTPRELPVQRRLPVQLSIENSGPQTWLKNSVRVGYHWYYQDGTEFLWEDETTPLPADVPPGGRVRDLLAWITAPPFDGTYWLVWDIKVGDTWASTSSGMRPFDRSVRSVQVIGNRLVFADLTRAYNLDGITDDDDFDDGDFDGQGHSFPAAWMPPYADLPVTPSGLWLPSTQSGPESPRRISFRFGSRARKEKNFLACRGQRVELGRSAGQCRVFHFVAASVGKAVQAPLKLIFQEPSSQSEDLYTIQVSRWDTPPTNGEEVAVLCPFRHARQGAEAGAVALYHYTIAIREPRKLVAVQLPDAPDLRIAAITLEK